MRTREEQVADLTGLYEDAGVIGGNAKDAAADQVLEAEQRGYECAKAECAADTRRLDNMREKLRIAKNGLLRVKEITGEASRAHQAADRALMQIAARPIDAAMEVE